MREDNAQARHVIWLYLLISGSSGNFLDASGRELQVSREDVSLAFRGQDCAWERADVGIDGFDPIGEILIDTSGTQVLYAANDSAGVYKSIDGAESWTLFESGVLPSAHLINLATDRSNPLTVYAGGDPGGVYKTIDGGQTWALSSNGLTSNNIVGVAVDPNDSMIIYAFGIGGVFKSTNAGANWAGVNNGLSDGVFWAVVVEPGNSSVVYSATRTGGIFKTTDGGLNWFPSDNGVTSDDVRSLAVDSTDTTIVYAGSFGAGIFKSTDSGASWSPANNGMSAANVWEIVVDQETSSLIYIGTDDGVFTTQDAALAWKSQNDCLDGTVSSLALDPITRLSLFAGTLSGEISRLELLIFADGFESGDTSRW